MGKRVLWGAAGSVGDVRRNVSAVAAATDSKGNSGVLLSQLDQYEAALARAPLAEERIAFVLGGYFCLKD